MKKQEQQKVSSLYFLKKQIVVVVVDCYYCYFLKAVVVDQQSLWLCDYEGLTMISFPRLMFASSRRTWLLNQHLQLVSMQSCCCCFEMFL